MADGEWYFVKNWWRFQHYRDRRPPWIKIHQSILSDPAVMSLSKSDRWDLVTLWLRASDVEGTFPARVAHVRHTCGCGNDHVASLLLARLESKGLISKNDIRGSRRDIASKLLQKTAPETETYKEETEKHPPTAPHGGADGESQTTYSKAFLKFWESYPKKVGKGAAWKAFKRAAINGRLEQVISAVENQKRSEQWSRDGGQYVPHPATWLNQRRWEDEPDENGGFNLG